MKEQEKIHGLQTLAELHADRIEGYKKVSQETGLEDTDLRNLFTALSSFSQEAKAELDVAIATYGGEMTNNENSFLSKVHQTWIDIKTAISSRDREALLSSCQFGEEVIIGAYQSMLDNESLIDVKLRMLLHSHLNTLKSSLQAIEEMKKLEEAHNE